MIPIPKNLTKSTLDGISLVCAVIIMLGLGRHFTQITAATKSEGPASEDRAPAVGARVTVPALHLEDHHGRTLVFAMEVGCAWNASAVHFYKEVFERLDPGIALVAVLPHPIDESRSYLKTLGFDIGSIVRMRLDDLHLKETPAVLLLDPGGVVLGSWVGAPRESEQQQIRNVLGIPSAPVDQGRASQAAASAYVALADLLQQSADSIILDVRPRDSFRRSHIRNALNIPVDELPVRAVHELSLSATAIIFCGAAQTNSDNPLRDPCSVAFQDLTAVGFERVKVLDATLEAIERSALVTRTSDGDKP